MKGLVCTKKIYFRPIGSNDIDAGWLEWINNPKSTKYLVYGNPTTRIDLESYLNDSKPPHTYMFAVCLMENDRYIGNVRLSSIDWINRRAVYGRLLGNADLRGQGIGTEMLALLAYYAFYKIGLNRIEAGVIKQNIASIRSNEKAGSVCEGVFRQSEFIEGVFVDTVRFGMTRDDFDKTNWKELVCLK